MVDESSCLRVIRNLISTCRKSGRKSWLDICVKTEEYLQEASVKQRLSILDIVWKWISNLVKKDDFTSNNTDEEFILLLTRVWCTIYLCSLGNLKLCQKVKKVFRCLCVIRPYHAKCEIKRNISELLSSPTNQTVNAVEIVCQLTDVSELGKECVDELFDDFVTSISHCLHSHCQQYIQQHCEEAGLLCNSDVFQTIVKAVLKTFQYFPKKVGSLISDSTATEGNTVLEAIINNLWRILFCKILPKECTFLCGTAIGLFLGIAADLEPYLCATEIVTQLLIASGASFLKYQAVSQHHHSVMIGCFKFELPLAQYRPITQLAIVMGIIKSQKKEILLEISNEEQTTLMEGLLFQTTYTLCKESKNSPVHYVTFEAMRQWLLCMKNLLKKKAFHEESKWMTSVESYHVTHLIEIIWENLEDPIDGVPGMAVTLFSLLLELHKDEETTRNSVDEAFYTLLMDKVIGLPWHVKGRYGLICSLLACIGLQQILEKQPTLLDDLIRCLGVNQLTSPSTNAFKAFLECGRKEKEQTEFVKQWKKSWQDGLFRALTSKDRLLQQNACLYWLPCVLKCIPETLSYLLEKLRDAHDKVKTANKTSEGTRFVSAYLSVLKVSRSLAILQTDDLDESCLHQGLTHLQDDIRATALSVISFTPKTAEPLSLMELKLLKQFLPYNLNSACAPFRQTLFVSMKKILGRIRDGSLILLREHFQLANQRKKDCGLPDKVNTMLEFVTWLFDLLLACFLPGASYQRQKTAMQLLVAILDVFSVKWQPDKKKGQPPASCHLLVSLVNEHGHLKFFSTRSAAMLFGCIESPYADIRDTAFYVLHEHFSWPLILLENDSTGKASASMLLEKALTLVRSPKVQDCESAAVIFRLIQRKYLSELEWDCDFLTVEVKPSAILGSKSSSSGKLFSGVQMLQQLLAELKMHVKAAQDDMKLASQNAPGHGILLAMAQSIEETFDNIKDAELCKLRDLDCWCQLKTVLHDTVDTASHIITDMMDMLSGNYASTPAIGGASFADIGQALDEILSFSVDVGDEEIKEHFSVQAHKDIVISCCWLRIKCACQLLAVIFEKNTVKLEHMSGTTLLDDETLKLVAETARKVILQCRHQGVVQNCRGSFMRICQCLFHSSQPYLYFLPNIWLNEMLNTVSSTSSVTSVTRRSAGLPVVFSTILSCEPTSGQTPLLKKCMESLLETAASPLPTVIDEHKDLPQVHAINILKALYQDTSLGCGVLQYASQGTVMAVTGFASSSWAVRNASMQLFGSLVKRMLGQRRGTDGDSEMNTINAMDFFNSYPALHKFFLSHLQSTADSVSNSSLFSPMSRPELFPILTLLSDLHPCPEANQSASSLLSDFVPHLQSLSSCPTYAVRVVAAKALVPFISCEHLLSKAKELVMQLPALGERFSQNVLHGTLLQISAVLQAVTWSAVTTNESGLLNEILKKIWICSCDNRCPLTRASFLDIFMKFGPSLAKDFERDCKPVHCIVMDGLEASDHGANHTSPGDALWHRTLVRACLECLFHQSWPKDNNTKEQRSLLSLLLSSTNKDRRLGALECLSKESHQMPNSIQVDLVNLIITETDHRCVVVALEMFVEVCGGLDTCLLSYANLKILCDKLASFARQTRGVSVAGKAIPAYSIALKFMISCQETISSELRAMLSEWREFIETYCQWEQDEVLRLGAVQSLQYFGVTVLWYAMKRKEESDLEQPCFVDTSISVLSSTLCLLQDEEEDIRSTAAQFVALISEPASSVTCSAALQLALHFTVQHFWSVPACWVAMETMIRGHKSTQDVLREYSRAKQMLFEQEDSNLYVEPVIFSKMVVEHFKIIISKILPCDKNNVADDFLEWLVTACQRLENGLRALNDSGLKDYGSLSNPKPFTVRFRVMCMAQVLWSAINSGLRNDCLKEINAVKELLVKMLEEIIQVNNPLHPWLTEHASELISIVREQEAKQQ